jgi:hypothetical protein
MKAKLLAIAFTVLILIMWVGGIILIHYFPNTIFIFMGLAFLVFCYAIYRIILNKLKKK